MQFEDPEIINEFVVESTEHLADIENQLLTIEEAGADIDIELVNTVFRGVHSIKGAAGFLGLTSINELAHSLENVLNLMREQELVPTSEIIDVMLRSSDELQSLLENVDDSNQVDVSQYVTSLEMIANGKSEATIAPKRDSIDCQAEASESVKPERDNLVLDDPAVDRNDPMAMAEALIAEMQAHGATCIQEMQASTCSPGIVEGQNQTAQNQAKPKHDENKSGNLSTAEVETTEFDRNSLKHPKPGSGDRGSAGVKPQIESSIRVSVESLDRLMNLAGELVLGRNQLLQTIAINEECGLEAVAAKINQVTCEMQDAIMQTRMQPIGNVFARFTRVVRDLSAKLKKRCQLVIEGKEVEVDKTIVEAIADPLTHLIRNAVDHGLELPETRKANGKEEQGLLQLRAFHQSGKVCIEIADDGAGINVDLVKDKAVEKGLITADQAESMTDRDAFRLILMPGFSTAETLSDVSGRGVGMDVVRTNIERLGGTVDIDSQSGSGTTILVTLPLTLAIIPSLMVRCRDDRFAIPQVNIVELVRLRSSEVDHRIGKVNNAEVLRLRGALLPLVRLRDALGVPQDSLDDPTQASGTAVNIIVVETGQLQYGLIVDGLCDSEEIVVKPLGRHLSACPCLSGATILGDGRVALILDVNGTAQQVALGANTEGMPRGAHSELGATSESTQSVLLFTNGPDEQFAIPMELIARIESVELDQIVSIGGEDLLHYRGGSLPLMRLENVVNAQRAPDCDRLYVVVFEAAGRELGVIATQLIDIRDVTDRFDTSTFDDPAVVGSKVIEGRTTRLLDTIEMAKQARPHWFGAAGGHAQQVLDCRRSAANTANGVPGSNSICILLAEDSSFFRRQVKGFLEDSGFTVVDCEDGRQAWQTLLESPQRFQIVLTDIEMPNMDGLELTRRIRSENQFAELPIVALTSLASQEDFDRGFDAGVTEYQVKLDRDELINAIHRISAVEPVEMVEA